MGYSNFKHISQYKIYDISKFIIRSNLFAIGFWVKINFTSNINKLIKCIALEITNVHMHTLFSVIW